MIPTQSLSDEPSKVSSAEPSPELSNVPSVLSLSFMPSTNPSVTKSMIPTQSLSDEPSKASSGEPSPKLSNVPSVLSLSLSPSMRSSNVPSFIPSVSFSSVPSNNPTKKPSLLRSSSPSLKSPVKKCVYESGKSKRLNTKDQRAKSCKWFAKENASYRKKICKRVFVLDFCYKTCTGC